MGERSVKASHANTREDNFFLCSFVAVQTSAYSKQALFGGAVSMYSIMVRPWYVVSWYVAQVDVRRALCVLSDLLMQLDAMEAKRLSCSRDHVSVGQKHKSGHKFFGGFKTYTSELLNKLRFVYPQRAPNSTCADLFVVPEGAPRGSAIQLLKLQYIVAMR